MAITDELRDWANSFHPYKDYPDLRAIADRIDAEHERVRAESITQRLRFGMMRLRKSFTTMG